MYAFYALYNVHVHVRVLCLSFKILKRCTPVFCYPVTVSDVPCSVASCCIREELNSIDQLMKSCSDFNALSTYRSFIMRCPRRHCDQIQRFQGRFESFSNCPFSFVSRRFKDAVTYWIDEISPCYHYRAALLE